MATKEHLLVAKAPPCSQPNDDSSSSNGCHCCYHSHCLPRPSISHGILESKRATITLFWSAAMHVLYTYSLASYQVDRETKLYSGLILGFLFTLYPISGWLADVYFSRIKTMAGGTTVVLMGDVLTAILVYAYQDALPAGFILTVVGHTLFEVNAILFGLDQLELYSTANHQVFIYWYYWTTQLGHFFYGLILCASYASADSERGFKATILLLCLMQFGSLLLMGVILWRWWHKFERHQVGFYPFKNIVHVLSYAYCKKHTTRPSAFTCSDKKPPTRMDWAKTRYGGIFSTEQVEDVKVFFYILFLLLPLSVFYYVDEIYEIAKQFQISNSTNYGQCLLTDVHSWMRSMLSVFLIPAYLMMLRPLLEKLSQFSGLLCRMGWGLVLTLCALVVLLGIEIYIAVYDSNHTNTTFVNNATDCYAGNKVTFYWLILPEFLNGLSYIIVFSTALEFICAQAPQGMKGLFIGLWYSFNGLDLVIVSIQNYFELDCALAYFVAKVIIVFGFILWYSYAARQYQFRKRQDIYGQPDIENCYAQTLQRESSELDSESLITSGHIQSIMRPEMTYQTIAVMKY